jgi:hypothetical protein
VSASQNSNVVRSQKTATPILPATFLPEKVNKNKKKFQNFRGFTKPLKSSSLRLLLREFIE